MASLGPADIVLWFLVDASLRRRAYQRTVDRYRWGNQRLFIAMETEINLQHLLAEINLCIYSTALTT